MHWQIEAVHSHFKTAKPAVSWHGCNWVNCVILARTTFIEFLWWALMAVDFLMAMVASKISIIKQKNQYGILYIVDWWSPHQNKFTDGSSTSNGQIYPHLFGLPNKVGSRLDRTIPAHPAYALVHKDVIRILWYHANNTKVPWCQSSFSRKALRAQLLGTFVSSCQRSLPCVQKLH